MSVLGRKQSKFMPVLTWLEGMIVTSKPTASEDALKLQKAVGIGGRAYQDFKY
jgi:hypothetical protein